jgi:hypothetical protein
MAVPFDAQIKQRAPPVKLSKISIVDVRVGEFAIPPPPNAPSQLDAPSALRSRRQCTLN